MSGATPNLAIDDVTLEIDPGDLRYLTFAVWQVGAGAVLILYCDGSNVIQLAGLVATIDDIGDVVITAAASGQMLRFNGSSWINEDSPYDVGMFIPGTQANGARWPRWY